MHSRTRISNSKVLYYYEYKDIRYSNSFRFFSQKKEMEQMLVFATDEAKKYSLKIIKEVWVPGSMEKPLAVKKLLLNKGIDAVAVLGIIEKGETAHGKTMADAVLPALIELQLEFLKPIGVGILGPEITPLQFNARLESYARKSVVAISAMLNIEKKLYHCVSKGELYFKVLKFMED